MFFWIKHQFQRLQIFLKWIRALHFQKYKDTHLVYLCQFLPGNYIDWNYESQLSILYYYILGNQNLWFQINIKMNRLSILMLLLFASKFWVYPHHRRRQKILLLLFMYYQIVAISLVNSLPIFVQNYSWLW